MKKAKKIMDPVPAATLTSICTRNQLEDLFDNSFVVMDFSYKGLPIDYAIVVTGRLIEVRHILTKEEYTTEMAMIGRAGRISFKKHKSIQEGNFISNAFYFMAPTRVLSAMEVPPKYGLITYAKDGVMDFKKVADWIKPDMYLTTSFYQTLCKKLTAKLYPR